MDGTDLVNITVLIAGRSYPLKVKEDDIDNVRNIVDEVNAKVDYFQKMYNRKDKQDCLSMALLTYAVDIHKLKNETSPTPSASSSAPVDHSTDKQESEEQLSKRVDELDNLLDQLLQ